MRNYNRIFTIVASLFACVFGAVSADVRAQTRFFRGSVGDSHMEMRLNIAGSKVTGAYKYDRIGQDIKLNGQLDAEGRLELLELGPKDKPTARISCKQLFDEVLDPDCMWLRLDGSREVFVSLHEGHLAFTDGMTLAPGQITDNKFGINASYPQLVNRSNALSAGAQSFNRAALASVRKTIKDFEPEAGGVYNINYIVLFAANDLISIEFAADSYVKGAAHPTEEFWAITYDLKNNRQLKLEDLFTPEADFKPALAKAVVAYNNARADAMERLEATREQRKPEPRDGSMFSEEELSEPTAWGITPKGLMLYFDLPHVIAFFDRAFVSYSAIKPNLRPGGPLARFQ
jgi:uncharacterized protein DUF3298